MIKSGPATVLGVAPQAFGSWTPPVTAAAAWFWAELDNGELATSSTALASEYAREYP